MPEGIMTIHNVKMTLKMMGLITHGIKAKAFWHISIESRIRG